MAVVAVCALLSLTAGPADVLTIKSWMSIMSPVKVLCYFTSTKISLKIKLGGYRKLITQQEPRLLKYSKLYLSFCKLYYRLPFPNLGIGFEEPRAIFLQLVRQKLTQAPIRLFCVVVLSSCLNGPSVSAPTPDLISSQPLLRASAPVPARGVCLQEQPLHPRALEM